eukprot:PLAT1827.2.p3 GENE.PLAT1827.2~~PLAT1827.2.p3  ORF type:complete len:112 (-),score=0.92 PLAT1827.2:121-456(-)
MFSKLSLTVTSALAILAVATPTPNTAPAGQCTTGELQCCQSVQAATDPSLTNLLGSLGIIVGDITGLVGLTCSSINVIGVGSGNECTANPVCCTNNAWGGLISLGCAPVEL